MKKIALCLTLVTALGIGVFTKDAAKKEVPVEYMHASWSHNYGSIEETSKNSDLVAVIKVNETEKEYTDKNNIPYTNYNVEVLDSVSKDNKDKDNITIVMTGVDNDERHVEFDDDPLLKEDEEFLVFLKENKDGTYKILGGPSGRLTFDEDSNSVTSLCLSNEQVKEANPYVALKVDNENVDSVLDKARQSIK
ncbi:hypothetical protein SAMN04487886_105016 [Clostridium sp. DSM 8431]|uniref:hypothetical protein n=1 Tax=Clostridium sp. DSM 8431 TaxID=1761781 RepID=UPI0008F45259|nr:hypothetical protein [Clostridium sp. DSM 8431]SFU53703.1 hypothetical protein SAMN04487886_105016 [Clostridium sp. DSM 8431]